MLLLGLYTQQLLQLRLILRSKKDKNDAKFYKESSRLSANNIKYEEIGGISAVENGWLISSCDNMANKSIIKLKSIAQSRGADAVIDVRWLSESSITSIYPQCQTGWGWILFWPTWLIPGTSDTTVTGTMIKYTNEQVNNSARIEHE